MATAAQLKAKANFKKAITYRKKNGCSLKEAFAAVYPKKAAAKKAAPKKKVAKKAAPKKKVGAVKKAAPKKVAKKAAPKKKAVSRHKDTNSHNVKISVVSGVNKASNLAKYGGLIRDERVKKVAIEYCKNRLKQLPVKERPALRRVIKQHEAELKNIKAQMALQKKLI
jgi:hypothetical protein